jgi:hypothetical protein
MFSVSVLFVRLCSCISVSSTFAGLPAQALYLYTKEEGRFKIFPGNCNVCFDLVHYASCNLWVQNNYIVVLYCFV